MGRNEKQKREKDLLFLANKKKNYENEARNWLKDRWKGLHRRLNMLMMAVLTRAFVRCFASSFVYASF